LRVAAISVERKGFCDLCHSFFVLYSSRVYRTASSDISDFAGMKDRVEIVCQLKSWYSETHKQSVCEENAVYVSHGMICMY
jgi:hypothetical protein